MSPRTPARRLPVLAGVSLCCWLLAASAASATTVTVDFDSFGSGVTLTTQVPGVTFPAPTGVQTLARTDARSAPNVGIEPFNGEFARHRFEAVFDGDQNTVKLRVKPETSDAPPSTATLRAYAAGGSLVDSDSVSMTGGSPWQLLSVGSSTGTPEIRRVELIENQGAFETNFVLVDDLEAFSADPPPPPPPADTTPPTVEIRRPLDGSTFDSRVGTVRVVASDDQDLLEVWGAITHRATGTTVGPIDGCGPISIYGACPLSIDRSHGFELDADLTGIYDLTVEACDAAGNCATDAISITYTPAPAPLPVEARWIELNQGVQGPPSDAFDFVPGDDVTYQSHVPLIALKDLFVRFYLFGDGGERRRFSTQLRVTIHNRDGGSDFLLLSPNVPYAGVNYVDVVADPGTDAARRDEMGRMRVDRRRTLNFVIPALAMANATRLELELDGVTGTIDVPLQGPTKLNVLMTQVVTPDAGGTHAGRPPADFVDRIEPYLAQAMPARVVASIPSPTTVLRIGAGLQNLCQVFDSSCGCALWQLDMSSSLSPSHPIYQDPGPNGERPVAVRLGVVDFDALDGVDGCAWVKDPSDPNNRRYAPAITEAFGDVAAHEIGHALGLIHVGNDHGEGDGHATETPWPYPLGTIGAQNFGVVLERQSGAPGSPGEWQATVVDTCPGATGTDRSPCPRDDSQQAHDFMSYGQSATDLGFLNPSQKPHDWVSDITYRRLHNAILHGTRPSYLVDAPGQPSEPNQAASAGASRATPRTTLEPALFVSGVVGPGGAVHFLPTLRREQYADALAGAPSGSMGTYTLKLFDAAGALLTERPFEPLAIQDDPQALEQFTIELPDQPTLARMVVEKDGAPVAETAASAHAPTVHVTAPEGGETFTDGALTIRWQASDADGDPLVVSVDLSPDGGATWETKASFGPGDPNVLTLPLAELPTSRRALARVRVSDGLLTAQDTADCTVSVNTAEPPECDGTEPGPGPGPGPGTDPDPPSDDYFVSPVYPDFGFQVRITGGAGPILGTFEPTCIPETLCVSGALPGRSEVFLRIVGPKPNGKLWPTLVKFSTSEVEVWVKQRSTGIVKHYRLEGARPGFDELPGLFDRTGFEP